MTPTTSPRPYFSSPHPGEGGEKIEEYGQALARLTGISEGAGLAFGECWGGLGMPFHGVEGGKIAS